MATTVLLKSNSMKLINIVQKKEIKMNSINKTARIAGVLYLFIAVSGILNAMYGPSSLTVLGDAATTVNNIMASESLFRLGIVNDLIAQTVGIFLVLALYKLLKPVNKNHAVLMVMFALVGIPIVMLNLVSQFAALLLLSGADYLTVFAADQLHIQMMFFLELSEQGVLIPTIFWGLWLFPLGYLIYKSGYFPRIVGVYLMIGCFGYLLDSFTHLILPKYDDYEAIFFTVSFLLTSGEILFMGWILVKGAKIPDTITEDT